MTKHDLKELAAMGAELGAAKAENERLRGLLQWFCDRVDRGEVRSKSTYERFKAALSPQAEPAPAQDERWAVHAQGPDELYAAFSREDAEQHAAALNALSMPAGIQVSAIVVESPWPAAEHWKYLAEQERDHVAELRATRPAQTEQQPVAWLHSRSGAVATEATKRAMEDGSVPSGYDIPLYAAPIAQAAPQPEQSGLVTEAMRNAAIAEYDRHDGEFSDFAGSVIRAALSAQGTSKFAMHQRVRKTSGSEWQGRICGTYSTALTPEGYAVESEAHAGSVQIYPAKALEAVE